MDKLKRPLSPSRSLHPTFLADEEPHHSPAGASVPLVAWLYWQRDPRRNPHCWTKVFAVLDDAFLWLFQREESAPRSLLVQLAVSGVSEATAVSGGRQLRVCDPNGEQLAISLCDDAAFELWYSRLQDAADLTEAFFRNSGMGIQDLPRSSHYRGTLVEHYRGSKRTRCKRAVTKMAGCWKRHQSPQSLDA
ncbi:hypothetical protein BBJ28_00023532 [Nothophytophthora sp. Chile5]|nr:hypothetical protein BBJ28_00023532 [Nothophytophthora sp. Chile5]